MFTFITRQLIRARSILAGGLIRPKRSIQSKLAVEPIGFPVPIGAGVLGAVVLILSLSTSPAQAGSEGAQSAIGQQSGAQDFDSKCNRIFGSPLCIAWYRNANYQGELEVFYKKNSGPRRYIRLYLASCGQPMAQVYEGFISPGQTRAGFWDGYIYPGSCWIGYMRIGNRQWTTGRLYS
jgi:hypothetical protein